MEQLYDAGIVGQEEQNKPRKILMSMEQFDEYISGNNKKRSNKGEENENRYSDCAGSYYASN